MEDPLSLLPCAGHAGHDERGECPEINSYLVPLFNLLPHNVQGTIILEVQGISSMDIVKNRSLCGGPPSYEDQYRVADGRAQRALRLYSLHSPLEGKGPRRPLDTICYLTAARS